MSVLATVAGKRRQIYCKNSISDQVLYVTIADIDIGSLESLHTIIYTYWDHMLVKFELNRMVRTVQKCSAFWQSMVYHILQSVDANLEDVSVTETIVNC